MIARAARAAAASFVFATTLGVVPPLAPCAEAEVAHAQGLHHAGLVIQFAHRPARTYCVEFTEDSITGLDLIERTGLPVSLQDYGAGNLAVCSIDGEGCDYPRKPCFCKCVKLTECTIWGFYRLDAGGAWRFSQEGAAIAQVKDGDVHGWRWARSTTTGGAPPNTTTLQELCASGTRIQATARVRPTAGAKSSPWPAVVAFAVLLAVLATLGARSRAKRSREQ